MILMPFKLIWLFNYVCTDLIFYNYLAPNEFDWNGKEWSDTTFVYNYYEQT